MQHQETLGVRMLPAVLLCWGLASTMGVVWAQAPLYAGFELDGVAIFLFITILTGLHHWLVTWSRSNQARSWDLVSAGSGLALMLGMSVGGVQAHMDVALPQAFDPTLWLELFDRPKGLGSHLLPPLVSLGMYWFYWLFIPLSLVGLTRRATRVPRCPDHGVELMFVMVSRFEPFGSESLAALVPEMRLHELLRFVRTDSPHAMRCIEIARCPYCACSDAVRVRSRYGIPGDGTRDNTKWYLDGGPWRVTRRQYDHFDSLRPAVRPLSREEKLARNQHAQDAVFGAMVGGFGLGLLKKSPTLYERSEAEE